MIAIRVPPQSDTGFPAPGISGFPHFGKALLPRPTSLLLVAETAVTTKAFNYLLGPHHFQHLVFSDSLFRFLSTHQPTPSFISHRRPPFQFSNLFNGRVCNSDSGKSCVCILPASRFSDLPRPDSSLFFCLFGACHYATLPPTLIGRRDSPSSL